MAQRTQIVLIDDLDGTEIKDGTGQSIAFRVGGRKNRPSSSSSSRTRVDTKAVRAWAASDDIDLFNRGRVPAAVLAKYRAAGN
jgi:hypothetical protein